MTAVEEVSYQRSSEWIVRIQLHLHGMIEHWLGLQTKVGGDHGEAQIDGHQRGEHQDHQDSANIENGVQTYHPGLAQQPHSGRQRGAGPEQAGARPREPIGGDQGHIGRMDSRLDLVDGGSLLARIQRFVQLVQIAMRQRGEGRGERRGRGQREGRGGGGSGSIGRRACGVRGQSLIEGHERVVRVIGLHYKLIERGLALQQA